MNRYCILLVLLITLIGICPACAVVNDNNEKTKRHFQALCKQPWKPVMQDSCTENWQDHWTLDGLKAKIGHSEEGMDFAAGPVHRDDTCHAVLWTKQSFKGDIRLDYEYTKLDDTVHNVTILYIQATGSGKGEYHKDIAQWRHLRQVASMRHYFNHMNTYHISYAAFGVENTDPDDDYIRARRYMPEIGKGLRGTNLKPDYTHTGLFKQGVSHKITVIKKDNDLYMHIRNPDKELLCHFKNDSFPPIIEGRVGLRHMYTRIARYKDIRISLLNKSP